MNSPQRVSVLIPTYNRAQFLKQTVDSVLRQTVPVHEVIVVDDGSTDNTTAVMRSCSPKVTLLTQNHSGVASARNHGMAHATGDWIAFLDSDDLWKPTKIERQLQYLSQHPECGLVHTGYSQFGIQTRIAEAPSRFLRADYRVEHLLFAEDWICTSSVLVRSTLPFRFHDWASAGQDIIYHAELLRAGVQFGYVNEPLVDYRTHLNSTNLAPGSQLRGASHQIRWIRETFVSEPLEQNRLLAILFIKALRRMEEARRWRRWPEYSDWRGWLAQHWPSRLPEPTLLHERTYPRIAYNLADVARKIMRGFVHSSIDGWAKS